ncbi:hypothetical protein [Streptomyces sp. AC512_CC834]|uniref:hypothetical protein n=1 Tax=Streptomyces sp. AC512_CC834 TaxID=2823691 RepID=UPI001C26F15E|nr:hypothetical protein [Streptomyces sp. AC512_CC834]
MTPWLRTLRATGLVGALGVGALVSPYGAGPAHGAGFTAVRAAPSPAPSAPGHAAVPGATADADGSGKHDGRGGQERPGRPDAHERPKRPDAGSPSRSAAESGPAGSAARGSPPPSPSPSASGATADPGASRAGSLPGEGRQRPGRAEERERGTEPDGTDRNGAHRTDGDGDSDAGVSQDPATAVPPDAAALMPSASPSRSQPQTGAHTQEATEPVLRVLPLGSGLVLVGLGLALALVGLRLRRG